MNNFCRKLLTHRLFRSKGILTSKQFHLYTLTPGKPTCKRPAISCDCFSSKVRLLHVDVCLQTTNAHNVLERKDEAINNYQHEELDSKVVKYADLATDVETKKKILMVLMEHEVAKLEGKKVPSKLQVEDMRELLPMFSFSSRLKYMSFLFEKEAKKSADKRRKEIKLKEREKWMVEKEHLKPPDHIQYGIGHNTMIVRVRRKSVNRVANQRLANAVLFGQKLVVDLDFDCFMRRQDCNNCGDQLLELYGVNRKNRYPYDLMFCNVDHRSTTMSAFSRYMNNLYAPDNFITVTDMSYLDIFPKENLIYITPYAKEPLKHYDPNAVYIIGGLVDKCVREPVVLAKAKREGIRAVHLPYDEYLMWGRGNKSLPLNQLLEILLEIKNTNDWNKAFRYVPQRKLVRSLDLFSEF